MSPLATRAAHWRLACFHNAPTLPMVTPQTPHLDAACVIRHEYVFPTRMSTTNNPCRWPPMQAAWSHHKVMCDLCPLSKSSERYIRLAIRCGNVLNIDIDYIVRIPSGTH